MLVDAVMLLAAYCCSTYSFIALCIRNQHLSQFVSYHNDCDLPQTFTLIAATTVRTTVCVPLLLLLSTVNDRLRLIGRS
jgi:hypothetical protein